MARFSLKVGDIFVINLGNGYKRYYQYIAADITQLNSEVIRVFSRNYKTNESPDVDEVIDDTIDFYAHVVCKLGIKLKFGIRLVIVKV